MMGMLKRLARRILNGPALTAAETADMLGYDETDTRVLCDRAS